MTRGCEYRVNVPFFSPPIGCTLRLRLPEPRAARPELRPRLCELGVDFADDDDFEHVAATTAGADAADFDGIDEAGGNAWYYTDKQGVP